MAEELIRVQSQPGIKRDGTKFEGDVYVDGQWVRFQRSLPRKIGGYRSINKYLQGLPRTLHEYTRNQLTYIHAGSANLLERLYIDSNSNTSVIYDRTPGSLLANSGNLWQFDVDHAADGSLLLMAQVAPNLNCICNADDGQLFYGDLFGTGALTELTVGGGELPTGVSLTGGVVSLHPYTFVFGNAGYVAWSVAGDPTDFTSAGSGSANITGQKIVRGMPLRGGPGNSPSGLFWSADSLLRASFVGGEAIFQFDTISAESSILSAQSVIEYDGIFYWIGTDRFLSFNGVVREIPNNINLNFFFDNVNYQYRQKVFAMKVPRFGEIWWCFPFGDATEPNHAIIYNVRENTWYDTPLPQGGRGAGLFTAIFRKPLMTGVAPQNYQAQSIAIDGGGTGYAANDVLTVEGGQFLTPTQITVSTVDGSGTITAATISDAGSYTETPTNPVSVSGGGGSSATFNVTFNQPYKLWIHEVGVDAVDGQSVQPIQSYFETADISLPAKSQINNALQVLIIEPDFVQEGNMTVQVRGRANARAPEVNGDAKVFVPAAQIEIPQQQIVYFKEQRRELRFRFESNVVGGDYQMGLVLAHLQKGDGTVIG
jgi:hypothetical protein